MKQTAKDLLKINAVKLSPKEPFTWASGIKSPIYCDNRLTISYPENEGADVIGVCAIFSYQLPSVNGNFEKAGVPFATLTNYTELLEAAVEESYITKEEQELLHRWREDPENWLD